MIDFENLNTLVIPEGTVHEIHDENGIRIWKNPNHILNRVSFSIDTDMSIYNNYGYIEGYRLSSSGSLKAQDASVSTGFIPYKIGDILRMSGVSWNTLIAYGYVYIVFYDSNFSYLSHINRYEEGSSGDNGISNAAATVNKSTSSILTDGEGVTTFNINFTQNLDIAYIRISATGSGADMIVTMNEEILKGLIPW